MLDFPGYLHLATSSTLVTEIAGLVDQSHQHELITSHGPKGDVGYMQIHTGFVTSPQLSSCDDNSALLLKLLFTFKC